MAGIEGGREDRFMVLKVASSFNYFCKRMAKALNLYGRLATFEPIEPLNENVRITCCTQLFA